MRLAFGQLARVALGPAGILPCPHRLSTAKPSVYAEGQGLYMKTLKTICLGTSLVLNLLAIGQIVAKLLYGK